jgi:hypothetical protein
MVVMHLLWVDSVLLLCFYDDFLGLGLDFFLSLFYLLVYLLMDDAEAVFILI